MVKLLIVKLIFIAFLFLKKIKNLMQSDWAKLKNEWNEKWLISGLSNILFSFYLFCFTKFI